MTGRELPFHDGLVVLVVGDAAVAYDERGDVEVERRGDGRVLAL